MLSHIVRRAALRPAGAISSLVELSKTLTSLVGATKASTTHGTVVSAASSISTATHAVSFLPVRRMAINLTSHKANPVPPTKVPTSNPATAQSTSNNEDDLDGPDDVEDSEETSSSAGIDPNKIAPDALKIDDSCVKQLQALKQKGTQALRITVDTGGCSGFQYIFSLVKAGELEGMSTLEDQVRKDEGSGQSVLFNGTDFAFRKGDALILVDDVSMPFLQGATIDYKVELIRAGFVVRDNPNVDLSCGCGTSFAKKSGK